MAYLTEKSCKLGELPDFPLGELTAFPHSRQELLELLKEALKEEDTF